MLKTIVLIPWLIAQTYNVLPNNNENTDEKSSAARGCEVQLPQFTINTHKLPQIQLSVEREGYPIVMAIYPTRGTNVEWSYEGLTQPNMVITPVLSLEANQEYTVVIVIPCNGDVSGGQTYQTVFQPSSAFNSQN